MQRNEATELRQGGSLTMTQALADILVSETFNQMNNIKNIERTLNLRKALTNGSSSGLLKKLKRLSAGQ
jgi:hypothetical protein